MKAPVQVLMNRATPKTRSVTSKSGNTFRKISTIVIAVPMKLAAAIHTNPDNGSLGETSRASRGVKIWKDQGGLTSNAESMAK